MYLCFGDQRRRLGQDFFDQNPPKMVKIGSFLTIFGGQNLALAKNGHFWHFWPGPDSKGKGIGLYFGEWSGF